ncbi:MAG: hypothetical protein QOH42_1066 [Blastocatellia bacterium]|nr:hypothetical protein [Blastocatellia bacterium]
MNKRFVKAIKLILVNLLVLVVLLEITSLAAYFIKTREFFYTRSKNRIAVSASDLAPRANDRPLIFQLHPYFGYVHQESYVQSYARQHGYATNDRAFLSAYKLPFKKTSNQFVIGLFGGSVSQQVGLWEMGSHLLANTLRRLPFLKDKEIILLNFAVGAYKQPQQLLVLSYFLSIGQEFDMVVNIDGFNEIALGYGNNKSGIDLAMPAGFLIAPLDDLANKDFSSDQLMLTLEVEQIRNELQDALTRLNSCRFATCYAFRWGYVKYLDSQYRAKVEAIGQPRTGDSASHSLIGLNRIDTPLDDQEAIRQIGELWANSSMAMNEQLTSRKIPYLEIIQPNQYHATGRHFTEQELKTAIDKSGLTREAIAKGYPVLLSKVGSLRAAGVNVVDAVNIFDQVTETVYFDNCCHLNERGQQIFVEYIAGSMVTLLEGQAGANLKR